MKILKLKLRGAIGIRKGLGLEEIEIDFTQYKPGLIALTGRNGSGKTTIMENLHPYRRMVSRDGSLQNHFFLKDSYRNLEFEHNWNNYQSRILIDALTGGSEAYLFCNGKPINDGKLTTYDQAINDLLGSEELFFNSVFSGQKSKGIAELKPAERRKLFYELLNLDVYEKYLEGAKTNLGVQQRELSRIEGQLAGITDDDLDQAREQKELREIELSEIVQDIEATKRDIEASREAIQEKEAEIIRLTEKQKRDDQIGIQIDNLHIAIANAERELIKIREDADKKIEEYKAKKSRNLNLIANLPLMEQHFRELKDKQNKLEEFREKESVLNVDFIELNNLKSTQEQNFNNIGREIAERKDEIERKLYHISDIQKEIQRLQRDADLISQVPCDESTGKSCQFLINSYAGLGKLEHFKKAEEEGKAEIEKLMNELSVVKEDLTTAMKEFDESFAPKLKKIKDEMTKINLDKVTLQLQISDNYKSVAEQKIAEARKAEMEIQHIEELENITVIQYSRDVDTFNKRILEYQDKILDANSELTPGLIFSIRDLKEELVGIKDSLNNELAHLERCEQLFRDKDSEITTAKNRIDQIKANAELRKALLTKQEIIQAEIRDWNFLCRAFDKTGIPVLKLENSGVEITSVANELLSLFENRFRIVFETTSLTKDKKKLKETFDINIVEDDGVCEIGNKSGGQQVWLETAIQLAISIVVRKQGRNLQTAFLDEKDGALDMENAYSYIEMIRKAHQMSGVNNTFIITHRPELLDFIPQQVRLSNGILEAVC